MRASIRKHFQARDPVLYAVIPVDRTYTVKPADNMVARLVRSIVGQQLSPKAASTIYTRFVEFIGSESYTPSEILRVSDTRLRSVGLSRAKTQYVKNIAHAFATGVLSDRTLRTSTDEQVYDTLTRIKGIGPWTADMFLMFTLGRENIFSYGDIGLQNAIAKLYTLKRPLSKKTLTSLADTWHPYKTYACMVLWDYLDSLQP